MATSTLSTRPASILEMREPAFAAARNRLHPVVGDSAVCGRWKPNV